MRGDDDDDENWPLDEVVVGAEDRNEDGDFVARVLAVADNGLRVEIAVSELTPTAPELLARIGAYHTKVWLLRPADDKGNPVFGVEGEDEEYVKEAVNHVCQYGRRVLEDVKEEWSPAKWANKRALAELAVKKRGGDLSTEVDELLAEARAEKETKLKRYHELKASDARTTVSSSREQQSSSKTPE